MGTVFSIYKRKPKERYELGKHRHGYPKGIAPPIDLMERMQALRESIDASGDKSPEALSVYYEEMMQFTDPGWVALWSIMGNPNYVAFRMSRWNRSELADKLFRGSSNLETIDRALVVADDLLRWAGDDEVTLIPEEPQELLELGWPTRGYRDTGSIWDALKGYQ